MSEKIKITKIYRHPRTGAIVVRFNFDFGYHSNVNFSPSRFEGLTKEQIKADIFRTLEDIYNRVKRQREDKTLQRRLDSVISELSASV